jgi:cytochrome c oxidase subunit 2
MTLDARQTLPVTAKWLGRSLLTALAAMYAAACSGGPNLSPEAARGLEVAEANGCIACHGETEVGPDLAGLVGSEVELDDGTTVVADRTYVERAIREPQTQIVAGYTIVMPKAVLSEDEVAALIAYIEEL